MNSSQLSNSKCPQKSKIKGKGYHVCAHGALLPKPCACQSCHGARVHCEGVRGKSDGFRAALTAMKGTAQNEHVATGKPRGKKSKKSGAHELRDHIDLCAYICQVRERVNE